MSTNLLDEDNPISGQKFVCVSFVSPENIIKKKELFFFDNFLKTYNFEKNNSKYIKFFQYLSYKHDMEIEDLTNDYNEFLKNEKDELTKLTLEDEYKNYLDKYEDTLQEKFDKEHSFATNVRGLKIRGSFESEELANEHAKKTRELDPNHNIFVGPVGMWIPWDPDAYKTGNVNYMEEDLQKLMSEKNKNELEAKQHFEERVAESKRQAIEENIKKAKKNNNKLTQNIKKDGNTVGVNDTFQQDLNTIETNIKL